ncbi:porin family protein [Hymenobacter coccineus]|nr:porin family protein [Hymenobacter coccineus]
MKKVILPLALLAGIVGTANAQTGIKYGVKGGYNLATFSGTDSKGSEYKSGFSAGLYSNFGISDNISIQPEVLFSQKGASIDNFQGLPTTRFKSTLSYIDVPVLLRVNAGEDGKGLFFELGPQASFLVRNRDFTQTGNTSTQSTDNTNNTDMNKTVLAYVGGIGYQITSGLSLGLRYTGDFTQVYKQGASTNYTAQAYAGGNGNNPSVHNSVFQFQVGYAFGGK